MNDFKEIELFGNHLKVFEDGKILVKRHYNRDEFYEKKCSNVNGYLQLQLTHKYKHKKYYIHRLVAFCFLELDLENPKSQVDHIDRNTQNNLVSNLRLVSNQENQFNRNVKGYSYSKKNKKWIAEIMVDYLKIYLGSFDNEEDARQAYFVAKEKYHIIQ